MSLGNTKLGPRLIGELLKNCKSVYFIGIGGINMSSLAHITYNMGYRVSGSDRTDTDIIRKLVEHGIEVHHSHDAKNVCGFDAVVYTVAISEDNPEYRYAIDNGLPCISRADYLGYIMTMYARRVGIAGMHGKSSCTSMCAEILIGCGADPTVLSGAELPAMQGAYCVGNSENFVFEACEYMDSFLHFNPNVAVILNIEMDHVDYFSSMEQIKTSFANYAALVGKDGVVIYNSDDNNVIDALGDLEARRISFAINDKSASFVADNIVKVSGRYSFDIFRNGSFFCHVDLRVPGYHNIYNSLAAAAACAECGVCSDDIAKGLWNFCGACRRMEYKGSVDGADVYDDYGHHPTEIKATLEGAKALGNGRLFCVYQPHTYSRTAALLDEFAASFGDCDRVIFADIYAAREINTFGVSSGLLAQLTQEKTGVKSSAAASFEECAKILESEMRAGDIAVVMGAGDIYKVFDFLKFDD